jgi:SAM-dependent methyltransferase
MELNRKIIFEWDYLNWSKAIDHWKLDELITNDKNQKVLLIGEREGGLSLYTASLGLNTMCTGYEGISESVVCAHKKYVFSDLIQYGTANIFSLPFKDCEFDFVVVKSVIGGLMYDRKNKSSRNIAMQSLAVEEIHRVLKSNGYYLGAENMKGSLITQGLRYLVKRGKIRWRHFSVDELVELLRVFHRPQLKFFGLLPTTSRSNIINMIAYKFNLIFDFMMPQKSKYIVFIKCKKL